MFEKSGQRVLPARGKQVVRTPAASDMRWDQSPEAKRFYTLKQYLKAKKDEVA